MPQLLGPPRNSYKLNVTEQCLGTQRFHICADIRSGHAPFSTLSQLHYIQLISHVHSPSCTSFHFSKSHTPGTSLHILLTPLTPMSGLVATRAKLMPETASPTNPSLLPRFRLQFISLYESLFGWPPSQQDSLSAAFHVSELSASWI